MRFRTFHELIQWRIKTKDWTSDPSPEEAAAMQAAYEASSPAHRTRILEEENARLRRLVIELGGTLPS